MTKIFNILERIRKYPGHAVAAAIITAFLIVLSISAHVTHSWEAAWEIFHVNLPGYIFGDLWIITHYAECLRNTSQAYGTTRCGEMNYPRIWLWISDLLKIKESDTSAIGVGIMGAFFTSVLLIFRRLNGIEGAFLGLCLLSSAALFAVQRANCDLIIFIILAALYWGDGTSTLHKSFLKPLAILLAAILKLFPIVALLACFLESHTHRQRWFILSLSVAFAAYCFFTADDIAYMQINTNSIHTYQYTFGAILFIEKLAKDTVYYPVVLHYETAIQIVFLLLSMLAVFLLGRSRHFLGYRHYISHQPSNRELSCFRTGMLIYIGVFFAIKGNWDYRLIFLIFCLPQSLLWIKMPDKCMWLQGFILCALVFLSLWQMDNGSTAVFYFGQAIRWLLCLYLLGFLYCDLCTMRRRHSDFLYRRTYSPAINYQ